MSFETPVVFIIFKRPETTSQVFQRIAAVRPRTLLIVADGARSDRVGEAAQVAATRQVVRQIDWPCTVLENYSEINLGCKERVASGLTWVFEQVEEAVILEDDCLPAESFFTYCRELLERYRNDERLMAVSGCNLQGGLSRTEHSYYFSKYPLCWGWATWRRAWRHFDVGMEKWPDYKSRGELAGAADSPKEERYWNDVFEREYRGEIDSWDYAWLFNCWSRRGLAALPDVNLVSNIGFHDHATHTRDPKNGLSCLPTGSITELRHPPDVVRNQIADLHTFEHAFCVKSNDVKLAWGKRIEQRVRHLRDRFLGLAANS